MASIPLPQPGTFDFAKLRATLTTRQAASTTAQVQRAAADRSQGEGSFHAGIAWRARPVNHL